MLLATYTFFGSALVPQRSTTVWPYVSRDSHSTSTRSCVNSNKPRNLSSVSDSSYVAPSIKLIAAHTAHGSCKGGPVLKSKTFSYVSLKNVKSDLICLACALAPALPESK